MDAHLIYNWIQDYRCLLLIRLFYKEGECLILEAMSLPAINAQNTAVISCNEITLYTMNL